MFIACPSCSASYDVPDRLMRAGREVRCTRCGNQWVPLAEDEPQPVEAIEAESSLEQPPPPEAMTVAGQTAMDRLAAGASPRVRDRTLVAAWVASVVGLLLLATALYVFRADLMAGWPPSARLFTAFGLGGPPAHP